MRKWIVPLMLLCLIAGCNDGYISAWAWDETDGIGARVGTNITPNNEVGVSAVLWQEDCQPRIWGVYGVRHLDPIEFSNPLNLDFLPPTLTAQPYIGGKLDYNDAINDSAVGPIAGTIIENILFIEYQYQSFEQGAAPVDNQVVFGLRGKFEF